MADTYEHAHRSTPLFCDVLADHAEQWEPLPFPDAPHMDLPTHLWNLAGEHGSPNGNGSFAAFNVIAEAEATVALDGETIALGPICYYDDDTDTWVHHDDCTCEQENNDDETNDDD